MTLSRSVRLPIRGLFGAALLAALAGCMSDSASYLIEDNNKHTITLLRNQDWFWKDSADVSIVPTRLPECQGSLTVKSVPRQAELALYWSPEEYAEPIYILDIEGAFYALSTQSCKVQPFKEKPANPGTPVGVFKEQNGRLTFEAAAPTAPTAPAAPAHPQ
jgi:hypothetical protein